MIRINLLGDKVDNTPIYRIQLVLYALGVLATMLVCFGIHTRTSYAIEDVKFQREQLDSRLTQLKEKTRQVDELTAKKKLLAEKLNTIANLKMKKQGPVHVMDELTKAIPVRAWITQIAQREDLMEFTGVAVDPQTVSEFMRKLDDSIYFDAVDLVYSRKSARNDVKLQDFSISAKIPNAADLQKLLKAKQSVAVPAVVVNQPPNT
jgi:type IV pilus assembly protein PilN